MTTGSVTVGSPAHDLYYWRSWQGTDSKYLSPGLVRYNPYWVQSYKATQKWETCYGRVKLEEFFPYCSIPSLVTWTANDQLTLLNKISAKIRGSSFNLGVSLGQGRETLELAVVTINRFRGAIRFLKRGQIGNAVRQLGLPFEHQNRVSRDIRNRARVQKQLQLTDVSSAWLELQYGWRPLIQDVYESAKAYEAIVSKPRVAKYSAFVSKRGSVSTPYNTGYPWVLYSVDSTHWLSKGLHIEVTEDLSSAKILGLQDPSVIAWELVPFSFVVDWFLPIGDYLEAQTLLPGLNARYYLTEKSLRKGKCVGNPIPNWSYNPVLYNCASNDRRDYKGSEVTASLSYFGRTIPASLDIPMPAFTNPLEFSTGRLANALALLHQVTK